MFVPLSLNAGDFEISITSRGIPATENFEVLSFFSQKTIHPDGFVNDGFPAGFIIDDQIYLGTGESEFNTIFEDFYVYSTQGDSWTPLQSTSNLPYRSGSGGFTVNGKGYLLHGGVELWEFDPITRFWKELAQPPIESRFPLVIGNNVYFVQENFFGNSVYRYSLLNDEWTKMNDFDGPMRFGLVGFVIDDVAYIGQGIDMDTQDLFNDFWKYDEATDSWSEVSGPTPRAALQEGVGFSLNGKGYIGLGRSQNNNTRFFQYTPETDSWQVIAELPAEPRIKTHAFVAEKKIYLMYGQEAAANNTPRIDEVWEFTPETF
ncbi:MAG: hypothetical protein AAF149_23620 [Bacteroidota bacterium]